MFSPKAPQDLTIELLTDSQLVVGDTVRLVPRALADGEAVPVRFGFASTRPPAATVDDSGRVAVLARDTFTIRITLRSGSLAGEPPTLAVPFRGIAARVVASVDSVRFSSIGAATQLAAAALDKQGDSLFGTGFTWTSANPELVAVDSTGRVVAKGNSGLPGTPIMVTADNRSDTVYVHVRQETKSVVVTPGKAYLSAADQTAQFTAVARDSLGVVNTHPGAALTWSSTAGEVVVVDNTGLATATGEGIAGLVARSDLVADTARIVVSRALEHLIVTPEQTALQALADQVQHAAQGVDQAGDTVAVPAIEWRSLDQGIATVDTAGVVTAVANGTALIVGSAGGQEDTVSVTIEQLLASVAITRPGNDTTLTSLQDSTTVAAEGRDRNGYPIPPDRCCLFSFTTDNPNVATVDAGSGLVVAQNAGSASITAAAGGFAGSRVVNVHQMVANADLSRQRASLTGGQQMGFTGFAYDKRGFRIVVFGSPISWTVRNTAVATFSSTGEDSATVTAQQSVNDSTFLVVEAMTFIGSDTARARDSALIRVGSLSSLCEGGTAHTGNVTVSQTWTRAQSPHCVGGEVAVVGVRLTIEAGAVVKFTAGSELRIGDGATRGELRAPGTSTLPIIFTALDADASPGQWGGLRTHALASNDSVILRNVLLEYAGAGLEGGSLWDGLNAPSCQGTIVLDGVTLHNGRYDAVSTACAVTIQNSVIRNHWSRGVESTGGATRVINSRIENNCDGVAIEGTATLADLRGTRITGNCGWPLVVPPQALNAIQDVPVDSLLGNARDEIRVTTGMADLTTRDLRVDRRLPWRLEGASLGIGGGRTLTVEAGSTIRLSGAEISVGRSVAGGNAGSGRIVADGNLSEIRFTSARDNPQPGDWSLTWLQQLSDTSVFRNVVFEYGGAVGFGGQLTIEASGAPVILDRVTSRHSSRQGIYASGPLVVQGPIYADSNAAEGLELLSRDVSLANSRFVGNGGHGLFASQSFTDNLQVLGGTFSANGGSGIKLCGDTATITDAVLTHNGSGLDVSFGGCPSDGSVTLESYTIENVRADSNATSGITYLAGAAMGIRSSRIVGNGGRGLDIGVGIEEFTGNRVTLNGSYPIRTGVYGLQALEDQDADSMLGNGIDEILVEQDGEITARNVTIRQRLPWRVTATAAIGGGRTLTVEPGTTVKLLGQIYVGLGTQGNDIGPARLIADGDAALIRFTSAQQNAQPGDWLLLRLSQLRTDSASVLRNVRLEYGGGGPQNMLEISGDPTQPVVLDRVTARRSQGNGIYAANVVVQGPIYADSNGGRGMALNGRDVSLVDSRFVGNGSHGLETASSARKLTIRRSEFLRNGGTGARLNADSSSADSSLFRRNGGAGITFCCDNNNPLRPSLLRSVLDSNVAEGVNTGGTIEPVVRDNQIIANGQIGAVIHNGGTVSGNRIRGNAVPLHVNQAGLGALAGQDIDSLLGNLGDTLVINCCGDGEVRATDTIRTRPELPWRVHVGLRFVDRTVWKLEPGSSVFLNSSGRIQIGQNPSCDPATQGAVLRAEGDDAAPIRFTSRNQTPGAWSQVLLECLSDTTKLRNVEVSYAGGPAIWVAPGTAGVPVTLDSVRVRRTNSTGIYIEDGAKVIVLRYLAADSNAGIGLDVRAPHVAVPAGSFTANGLGLFVYGRGFSLSNADVSLNQQQGIRLATDSVTITNSRIARNGSTGITILGVGHLLSGLKVDTNASHGVSVSLSSGPTRLTNNLVRGNGGDGIITSGDGAQFFSEFSGNTITGNGGYGVVLDGASLGPFAAQDQSTLLGNARDTLCICSGPNPATFTTGSPTITAGLPWKNQRQLRVGGGQTLAINAGATLVMDNSAMLMIGNGDGSTTGRLMALGTAANPARVVGRDTTPGSWFRVSIDYQSDSSVLRHTEIAHGGAGGESGSVLLGLNDPAGHAIRLDTVTVRKSASNGVGSEGTAPVRITGLRAIDNSYSGMLITGGTVNLSSNRYERNGLAGIRVIGGGLNHVISGSILRSNGEYGLTNETGSSVLAENNWWGSNAGPGADGNNPVNGLVDFDPWLLAEPTIASAGLRAHWLARGIESRFLRTGRVNGDIGSP